MIAINHPFLGASGGADVESYVVRSGASPVQTPYYARLPQPIPPNLPVNPPNEPIQGDTVKYAAPPPALPPTQPPNEPIQSSTSTISSLPIMVTGLIDPVTGVSYSGQLTPDAQTLYQSGSLVTSGNELTTQGSALAAQGDLITGTPAPSAAQIAASVSAPVSSSFFAWFSEETIFAGVPNGAIAAGAVFGAALLFGGRKRRR